MVALASVVGAGLAQPAWAQDGVFSRCIQDVAARDLAAKVAYQHDLRDLIVRDAPQFESLASLSMELQAAMATARAARYDFLLQHDPARIKTDRGLSAFRNFDWSEDDDAILMQKSDAYRALQERIAQLRSRNDGHPDWPALRALVRDQVMPSSEFRDLTAKFSEEERILNKDLGDCRVAQ